MIINKYMKNSNIIHSTIINGINDIKVILPDFYSIFKYIDEFHKSFSDDMKELNILNYNLNLRYIKEFINHGTNPKIGRVLRQNINCYKNEKSETYINIYYDLTTKYNEEESVILNRFTITYYLIQKLLKEGYNVNFTPVLFLKAFDNLDNNEYIFIKFNNLDIDKLKKYNLIANNAISRILLPEIVNKLNVINKDALDYNGYLLERSEKESIIGLNKNDLLIDMFTSDELFNGDIEHDSKVFLKKLNLK